MKWLVGIQSGKICCEVSTPTSVLVLLLENCNGGGVKEEGSTFISTSIFSISDYVTYHMGDLYLSAWISSLAFIGSIYNYIYKKNLKSFLEIRMV